MLPFRHVAALVAVFMLLIPMTPAMPAPLGAVSVAAATQDTLQLIWSSTESSTTQSVAWGDVDGDGDLDLAVGNDKQPNQLYINLKGVLTRDSTWNPEQHSTRSVAWGDIDGDGDLDLAVGNSQQPNQLYRNQDGILILDSAWNPLSTDDTQSVAWGDVDGDGDLDLAVGTIPVYFFDPSGPRFLNGFHGGGTFLYRNDNGTLTNTPIWSSLPSPESSGSYSVAWGDVDGDGDLDLAVGKATVYSQPRLVTSEFPVSGQHSQIYRNDDGKLTLAPIWSSSEEDQTRSVAWGDIDNDGDLDLAVGNERRPDGLGHDIGGNERLYRNDGGSLTTTAIWTSTQEDDTRSVVWNDVDGDDDLDLTSGNNRQPSQIYRGCKVSQQGDGCAGVAFPLVLSSWDIPASDTTSIAWGDMDNDGKLDLAIGNGSNQKNTLYCLDNILIATNAFWHSAVGVSTKSLAWGDVDSDGDLDLAVGNDWQNQLYRNQGGVMSLDSTWQPMPSSTTSIAWGDVDSDGDLDLAVGNNGQSNQLYRYQNGGLTLDTSWSPIPQNTTSVAWADVDSDGDLDLAVGNDRQPNQLYRYQNGGLTLDTSWSPIPQNTTSVAWADVNSDGNLDLAVGNDGQSNQLYLNNGKTFTDRPSWSAIRTDQTKSLAWGDMDGDGDLDLAVGNGSISGNSNRLYRNDGGMLNPNEAWSSDETDDTRSLAWGDMDGDGDLDLAVGNTEFPIIQNNVFIGFSGGETRVYRNGSADSFGLPANPPTITTTRPGPTRNANFYSTPEIQVTNLISIPYTLADPEGDPVRQVRAEFSFDGGGKWRPAIAATSNPPITGQAITLDGSSQAIQSTASVLKVNTALTAEAWIFPTSNTGNQVILNREGEYELGRFSDGTIRWALANTNPGWAWQNSGFVAPLNRWTHIALVYSGIFVGSVRVYANGNLVDSYTGSGLIGDADPANNAFRIGSRQAAFDAPFVGRIDDVRIWNVTRTQAKIRDTMHRLLPGSVSGLRGEWHFDNAQRSANAPYVWTMPDSSGNAADGTLLGYSAAAAPLANGAPTGAPHTFVWDTFASGFFGQSDNVVVRMLAYPALSSGPNGTPLFQRPYASATTFPFRVRGTQVRVVNPQNVGQPDAVVFRLNDRLPRDQQLFAASTTAPAYTTNTNGYLAGRGALAPNDQLVALAPVPLPGPYAETYSQTVRLYATNIITTSDGISGFTVNSSGVQTVTVSLDHPFMLFDLSISLEWDARYDARYMTQLEGDLARVSELLFQVSHGQAALGKVTIFHDKEYWDYADIRIYASNRVRPSALIGGVARLEISDPTTPAPVTYGPGQVHMGATWNRFGSSSGSLSEDWPRTLVHELGHYLFFLEDNYLGMAPNATDTLQSVTTCPGLMSDTYAGIWQFQTRASWLPGCAATFSNQTSTRADWETIQTFYPALKPPAQPIGVLPSGPIRFPLATTEIASVDPLTPTARLDVPIFYTTDATGGRLIPGLTARGYLFQHSHGAPSDDYTQITPLGRANTDQLLARGARVGDRICLFEPLMAHFGCETISTGDEVLTLRSQPTWQPDIQVTPVTSTTLDIQVTGVPLNAPGLRAELYPLDDDARPLPITLNLASNGVYQGAFKLGYPLAGAYIHLSTTDAPATWEAVTSFALGGNGGAFSRIGGGGGFSRIGGGGGFSRIGGGGGFSRIGGGGGFSRIGGGGGFMRTGSAPVSSAEGDVLLTGKLDFTLGQFLLLQTANSLPNAPSWATLIGQGYRFTTSLAPNAPNLVGSALSFSYLDSEVPPGEENGIQVYYRSPSATQWTAISTTLDTAFNLASIPTQGPGLYALMTSIHVPLLAAGWNNFSYPVSANREVGQALASINGKYRIVYSYVPAETPDSWMFYAPAPIPAWVSDLKELTFGRGYWIYMTEATDLLLNGSSAFRAATTGALSLPPAVIYGVAPTNVANGQTVEAWVGSTRCGSSTTQLEGGQVVFKVKVAAIGLTTPNCGNTGSKVTITVAGNSIGSIAWDNTRASNLTPGINHAFLPLIQR